MVILIKISNTGITLVTHYEGLYLNAYWDSTGKVWTIGYGHTGNVYEGMKISEQQAVAFLKADMEYFENIVSKLVKVPLRQHEFDSLVSFTFNVGEGTLGSSTLLQKLNSGNYKGSADEFLKFVKSGGVFLEGLRLRRISERELFLTGELNFDGNIVDLPTDNKEVFNIIKNIIYPSCELFPRKIPRIKDVEVISVNGDIVKIKTDNREYKILKKYLEIKAK